jgi:hypothetical protein
VRVRPIAMTTPSTTQTWWQCRRWVWVVSCACGSRRILPADEWPSDHNWTSTTPAATTARGSWAMRTASNRRGFDPGVAPAGHLWSGTRRASNGVVMAAPFLRTTTLRERLRSAAEIPLEACPVDRHDGRGQRPRPRSIGNWCCGLRVGARTVRAVGAVMSAGPNHPQGGASKGPSALAPERRSGHAARTRNSCATRRSP